MVPEFPLTEGVHCWSKTTSREMKVIKINTDSDSVFEDMSTCDQSYVVTLPLSELSDVTTLSPYGNYTYLKNVSIGVKFFRKDHTCWVSQTLISKDGEHVVCRGIRGGTILLPLSSLEEVVSFFPPDWSGDNWRLNPFTYELWMRKPHGGKEIITKHMQTIRGLVQRYTLDMPGLLYVYDFMMNNVVTDKTLFKIKNKMYYTWNTDSLIWVRCNSEEPIPDHAIPGDWQRGAAVVISGCMFPSQKRGWYATPFGVHFTQTNYLLPYKEELTIHDLSIGINLPTFVGMNFDSMLDLKTFESAYLNNSVKY